MIVRPRPTLLDIMFAMRGSIVPQVAPKVAVIALVAVGAVLLRQWLPQYFHHEMIAPFTLVGLALSIFLSFRNSACYDRWWEARKLWGALITESRGLAREVNALFPGDALAEDRARILRLVIAFAHGLAARLRGHDEAEAAAVWSNATGPGVNAPNHILEALALDFAAQARAGRISDIMWTTLEAKVSALAAVQAGCERIRGTPLPFVYTLLLNRTAYLFCVLLPFGLADLTVWATPVAAAVVAYTFFGLEVLGHELEDPFSLHQNGLPLDAMVRTVEIDVLTILGEPAPEPLKPVDHLLT